MSEPAKEKVEGKVLRNDQTGKIRPNRSARITRTLIEGLAVVGLAAIVSCPVVLNKCGGGKSSAQVNERRPEEPLACFMPLEEQMSELKPEQQTTQSQIANRIRNASPKMIVPKVQKIPSSVSIPKKQAPELKPEQQKPVSPKEQAVAAIPVTTIALCDDSIRIRDYRKMLTLANSALAGKVGQMRGEYGANQIVSLDNEVLINTEGKVVKILGSTMKDCGQGCAIPPGTVMDVSFPLTSAVGDPGDSDCIMKFESRSVVK